MSRIRQNHLVQLFIIYLRYLLGSAFVFASIVKIRGDRFTSVSGADHPLGSAWHFFETMYASGLYWQFIGVAQLLAGFFMMTQRYARVGLLLYMCILVNIFVIVLSHDFGVGTPVVTGLMLGAALLLFIWEWPALKVIFGLNFVEVTPELESLKIWSYAGCFMFLFTVTHRCLEITNIFLWILGCLLVGGGALIYYVFTNRQKKN